LGHTYSSKKKKKKGIYTGAVAEKGNQKLKKNDKSVLQEETANAQFHHMGTQVKYYRLLCMSVKLPDKRQ